jgi:hypothetical protein
VLRQIVELIPTHLVSKLAKQTGVQAKTRSFSALWMKRHIAELLRRWGTACVNASLKRHTVS